MQIFIFITAFFIFLYRLYKLSKDDHIFLRKNIKMEEIFDVAFISAVVGLIFAQIFSPKNISFLTFFVFGTAICLILIAKYRKFPMGRFLDFFTLSFITVLPIFFLVESVLFKRIELILYLISSFVYLFLAIYLNKILFKRILSRTLKEGIISTYFIIFFSALTFSTGIVRTLAYSMGFFSLENVILIFSLLAGFFLLFL